MTFQDYFWIQSPYPQLQTVIVIISISIIILTESCYTVQSGPKLSILLLLLSKDWNYRHTYTWARELLHELQSRGAETQTCEKQLPQWTQLSDITFLLSAGLVQPAAPQSKPTTQPSCLLPSREGSWNFLLLFLNFLVFQDKVSLCGHGCPGTLSVEQVGLELMEIYLPLSPE